MSTNANWDFDAAQRLGRLWMDLFTRALTPDGGGGGGSGAPAARSTGDAAREMRSVTFNAMSKQADRLMRSPDFLDAMKQTMDASLDMQRRTREWLTQARHQTEGVAVKDVDSLMVLMRHMETRVLDRMDVLSEQLARIEDRLDAIERRATGASPPAPRGHGEATAAAAHAAGPADEAGSDPANGNGEGGRPTAGGER